MTETFRPRRATGRPGGSAWIGGMLGRLGVLAAVLALALVGGAVGRTAEPTAAAAAVFMCNGAQINTGGCVFPNQDTPDLKTLSFDNRASSVIANSGQVALYSDINYQGRCQTINPDVVVPLAGSFVGDNAVSSVRMGPCRASDWTAPQKLWAGNPSATGSGPYDGAAAQAGSPYHYVGDVKVITGSSSGISCGSDWVKAEFTPSQQAADLNRGAGGSFVYLCYRMSTERTFNIIYAVAGDSPDVFCDHPSHYKVPGDLNKGAGGKFIYFCVADKTSSGLIVAGHVGIAILFVRAGSTGTTLYQAQDTARQACYGATGNWMDMTDLNAGAGGDYIFTCWRHV